MHYVLEHCALRIYNHLVHQHTIYILDSDSTQLSGDLRFDSSNDPVLAPSEDREYIMASQILISSVEISPNTTSSELKILVTASTAIGLDQSSGGLVDNGFNGLILQLSAK